MFKIEPYEFEKLKQITDEVTGKRVYQTPNGKLYPSITTALSILSKDKINEWKKRVGEKEAKAVSAKAVARGKSVHKMAQDFLMNKEINLEQLNPFHIPLFKDIKRALNTNITLVHNIEFFVYSHKLKLAGQSDLFANWNGAKAIIDFKTSKKPKKKEWIEQHFLQATLYALCIYELKKIEIPKIIIIIATDEGIQIFEENLRNWVNPALNFVRMFHDKYSYEETYARTTKTSKT